MIDAIAGMIEAFSTVLYIVLVLALLNSSPRFAGIMVLTAGIFGAGYLLAPAFVTELLVVAPLLSLTGVMLAVTAVVMAGLRGAHREAAAAAAGGVERLRHLRQDDAAAAPENDPAPGPRGANDQPAVHLIHDDLPGNLVWPPEDGAAFAADINLEDIEGFHR